MAPAFPITTTTTVLRQSVVVSPSDRCRGRLSREPTWVAVHQNLAAGSKSPRLHSTQQTTFRFCQYVSRSEIGLRRKSVGRRGSVRVTDKTGSYLAASTFTRHRRI